MLAREVKNELVNHIIPFWNKLEDKENGGFYGFMDSDLKLDKNADKGVILHSRILWFYSNCYLVLKDGECLEKARHAFEFMRDYCVDREYGGVYWMMKANGEVADSMKHVYCNAFFIYAMSSYYDASKDKEALNLAMDTFRVIEEKGTDDVAYLEAMTREWKLMENDALSENGLMADKTMNTTLHLIEAYTELYRVSKDAQVLKRLKFLLDITYDKIYDKENSKLLVFFDKNLNEIGDIYSYGHDIEATWLIDRACEVIGDEKLAKKFAGMNSRIVEKIADVAFENGALNNEVEHGVVNKWRIWWVQAEGVVGFLNAYQKYDNARYLDISHALWEYIKGNIIDPREGGEWYSQVDEQGNYAKFKPEVDPWKCPYHDGRMCLEVIKRS